MIPLLSESLYLSLEQQAVHFLQVASATHPLVWHNAGNSSTGLLLWHRLGAGQSSVASGNTRLESQMSPS